METNTAATITTEATTTTTPCKVCNGRASGCCVCDFERCAPFSREFEDSLRRGQASQQAEEEAFERAERAAWRRK